jgi:hypothetical protein
MGGGPACPQWADRAGGRETFLFNFYSQFFYDFGKENLQIFISLSGVFRGTEIGPLLHFPKAGFNFF